MSATFSFGDDYQKWLAAQPKTTPAGVAFQLQQQMQPNTAQTTTPTAGGPTWQNAQAAGNSPWATLAGADGERMGGSPFMGNVVAAPPTGMGQGYQNPNNNGMGNTTTSPSGLPGAETLGSSLAGGVNTALSAKTPATPSTGGTFKPGRTRTAGAQSMQEAGWTDPNSFTPDWQFVNGRLHGRISTHPEDIQMTVMRWALNDVRKGMPLEQAYNKALQNGIDTVNETGAADSAFTLHKYTNELGAVLQQMMTNGYFDRNAWDEAWKNPEMARFLTTLQGRGRGFVQYDGKGGTWDTSGKGQITGDGRTGSTEAPILNSQPQPQQFTPSPVAPTPQQPGVDPVTGKPKTPAPVTNTVQPPTAGGLTAAQKQALVDDPDRAYKYMMQRMGYNTDAPGMLGKYLKQRFQPLLEARMAASNVSDSANYADQIDQTIGGFGSGLFDKANGGNFFSNLRQTGRDAAQNAQPFLNNLQDQSQAIQYLNQLGVLNYAGSNPLVQQSAADEMARARSGYEDFSFNNELAGKNIDPYTEWLQQQERFRYLFGY